MFAVFQKPDNGNTPGGTNKPGSTGGTGNTGGSSKPSLPVTGQLWWPVWPMALAGFALFEIGRYRREH